MADRYQDRPYPADGRRRGGDQYGSDRGENDPLAELARLIGQTDPFGTTGRSNTPAPPHGQPREPYQTAPEPQEAPDPAGPPQWVQRANYRREAPRDVQREIPLEPQSEVENEDYPDAVHPARRYGPQPQQAQPGPYYRDAPSVAEPDPELDPTRYDEALYGQIETGAQNYQRDPAYPDDPYAYQSEDDEEADEPVEKRRGGLVTVVVLLALAVVGTGAAWAYHSYFASAGSGEPPIIRADNSPTKIVPAPPDGSTKVPDRLTSGDGTEKIVPREEAPVDVDASSPGPRVVFPPLNQNSSPPSAASVSPSAPPPATVAVGGPSNGTLPNSEPHKIRTVSVRGDQSDVAAAPNNPPADTPPAPPPAARPAAATRSIASKMPKMPPASANASANAPLSLAPQAQSAPPAETRVAATNPTQTAPSGGGSGGYLVQLSSQHNEADAKASFKALQSKFPDVLGSQTPVIKRADLGEKGVHYRALVGPFATHEEAAQFCSNLIGAGGQCFVPKN